MSRETIYKNVDELPDLIDKLDKGKTTYKSVDELPDLKKKDLVTGTGGGSIGGTVGDSKVQSKKSTEYAPYVFNNKPVSDNVASGSMQQQQSIKKDIAADNTKYINEERPKEIEAKAKEIKSDTPSSLPKHLELNNQFDGVDFLKKDIIEHGGGKSLAEMPSNLESLNLYFGNDANNAADYFKQRTADIDKEINDLYTSKQQSLKPSTGDIATGVNKPQIDPITGKPFDNTTAEDKATDERINELKGYKNKLAQAQSTLAKKYAGWLAKDADVTTKGKIYDRIMGDEYAAEQQRLEDKGIPITQEQKYNTDIKGLEVSVQELNDEYEGKPKDDTYYERLAHLNMMEKGILNKYPEYKRQQGGKLIAQLAMKDEKLRMAAQTGSGELDKEIKQYLNKTYGISEKDLKGLDYGDIPSETMWGNIAKGVTDAATGIVTGVTRIGGTVLGVDEDRLTHINEGIGSLGSKIFGDNPYAKLQESETLINQDLKTIANPNAGKYNYNAETIKNAVGSGIGGLLGFIGGTKGVGKVLSLSDDAAMTSYLIGSGFEHNYQKAGEIMGKDASEVSKGLYATGMGYLEALAFKVLPKDKIFFGSAETKAAQKELAKTLSGVTLETVNRDALESGFRKVLKAAAGTTEETAKIGGAMSIAEMAKTAAAVLLGEDKDAAKFYGEGISNIEHLVRDLPFSMGIPLGLMEIPKYRQHSNRTKQILFDAGSNYETHIATIKQAQEKGLITPEQAEKKIEVVQTMQNIVKSLPDKNPQTNEPLTQKQQVEYAYNRVKEIAVKTKSDEIKDAALTPFYKKEAQELVDERTAIVTGEHEAYKETAALADRIKETGKQKVITDVGTKTEVVKTLSEQALSTPVSTKRALEDAELTSDLIARNEPQAIKAEIKSLKADHKKLIEQEKKAEANEVEKNIVLLEAGLEKQQKPKGEEVKPEEPITEESPTPTAKDEGSSIKNEIEKRRQDELGKMNEQAFVLKDGEKHFIENVNTKNERFTGETETSQTKKINEKYDAELTALEKVKSKEGSSISVVDSKLKQKLKSINAPEKLIDAIGDNVELKEGMLADNDRIVASLLGLAGTYNRSENTIKLGKFYSKLMGDKQTVIHEAAHAATMTTMIEALQKNPKFTPEQQKAAKELNDIAYDYLMNTSTAAKLAIPTLYGTTTPFEFVAEFVSNKNFRKWVSENNPENNVTYLNYIWKKILKLFGVNGEINNERIETISKNIDTLLDASKEQITKGKEQSLSPSKGKEAVEVKPEIIEEKPLGDKSLKKVDGVPEEYGKIGVMGKDGEFWAFIKMDTPEGIKSQRVGDIHNSYDKARTQGEKIIRDKYQKENPQAQLPSNEKAETTNDTKQAEVKSVTDVIPDKTGSTTETGEGGKKEPPKEPTEPVGEADKFKDKGILNRLFKAENTPQESRAGFEEKGLKYEPQSVQEAEQIGKAMVDQYGIEDAVTLAETNKFKGGVNSAIFAESLNRLYEQEQAAKTPQEKIDIAQKFAEVGIRYDEFSRGQGRDIKQISHFYKKSPLGVQIMENVKRKEDFEQWSKPKDKSWKEFFDEMMKEPEFEKEVSEKVKEEMKKERAEARSARIKKVDEFIDKAKDQFKGGATYSTIIPPQVITAALEGMKKAYHAGEKVAQLVQDAIDYISEQLGVDTWDKEKFRKEWEGKLRDRQERKPLTDEELKTKILDRFRKKLKGLTDKQKEEVVRKSFQKIVESGGLDYADFKKIIADITGRGELTVEEANRLKELVKETNLVDDAAKEARENRTQEARDKYFESLTTATKASRELNELLYNRPNIIKRLTSIMQLNTLGIPALVNNPVYNVVNQVGLRLPIGLVKTGIDATISGISKATGNEISRETNILALQVQKEFFKKLGLGLKESFQQFFTGLNRADYTAKEIQGQQIRPATAIRDLWKSAKGEKHLNREQKVDKAIQATVGIPAEIVARTLNLGDKPQRFAAEGAQAAAFAKALGLKDIDYDLFIDFPREEAYRAYKAKGLSEAEANKKADYIADTIIKEGQRSTFQQDNMLNDIINKAFGGEQSGIGSAAKAIAISPYIKIPSNAYWSYYNLVNPEIAFLQSMIYGTKAAAKQYGGYKKFLGDKYNTSAAKDLNEAKYWFAHGMVGIATRAVIMSLIGAGIARSSNTGDDTKKEREGEQNYEQQGTINVSKLSAAIQGENPDEVKNGLNVQMRWFGHFGSMINSIAKKQEEMTPEQKEAQDEFWNIAFGGMEIEALKELNQGVFGGTSSMLTAIERKDFQNYGVNLINMIGNIVHPAALAQISRAQMPYYTKRKADTFLGELKNSALERSSWLRKLSGQYPPSKIGIWGDKLEKKDNTAMRLFGISRSNDDNFAQPLYEDYKRTDNTKFFPPAVMPTIESNGVKQKLPTADAARLEELVGNQRKILIAPYVNDMATFEGSNKTYSQLTDEEKVDKLNIIYEEGYKNGKAIFLKEHPKYIIPEETNQEKKDKKKESKANKKFRKSVSSKF